ncbi:H(+)-transporting V0 sector ATPase subunit d [Hanseniaspora osmophila]|uniref:V-type proton ATPase subunit n=1 Tax=Hanseniaspora osmophila TaxID=56408 RepID=A0A1E5RI52_9ASCO|nr:V-type proton ATPase subunit d [Hanseniaspora osmophila]
MEGVFFNIDNGYLEGVVRGYRNGLINQSQYMNLCQCETLDDLKLQLSSTDYGSFLNTVPSDQLTTSVIQEYANNKLFNEFQYLMNNANEGTTKKFFDYLTYNYMIDNVILMINGTIHNRDKAELLSRCHPLGFFDTLPTLTVATDLETLYSMVLVDTPLSPYFKNCFGEDAANSQLDDLNIEIIKNKIYKEYLLDFYNWVSKSFPDYDPTKENMLAILKFEADRRTINILLNSLEHPDILDLDLKKQIVPELGRLYPIAYSQLLSSNDLDYENIKDIVESCVYEYKGIFDTNSNSDKNLEDYFYELEMEHCKDFFTQQFALSAVYAWLKSKEQEVRNITWIAECIAQNQKDKINNYIAVY